MDARQLKELELHDVARLYGLVDAPISPLPAAAATLAAPRPVERLQEKTTQAAPQPAQRLAEKEIDVPRKTRTVLPPVVVDPAIAGMDWETLRASVRACTKCELCKERKQAVFGVGSRTGPWLFVGEGPGADEDETGEPFVGQAGKLLDNMLAAAGLKRGRDAYIANVVNCRPPGNRTPLPLEVATCAAWLDRQVELVAPKLLVALGKTAAVRLLGEAAAETSLGSLRGRLHDYKGTPLVITYHPAYLLRNLPDKSKAWEDLLFARRSLAGTGPA